MSTEPNLLRWAIKEAEENHRAIAQELGSPVTADFEGKLAHAHKACDEAEELRAGYERLQNEHLALRLSLRTLTESIAQVRTSESGNRVWMDTRDWCGWIKAQAESAKQILSEVSRP